MVTKEHDRLEEARTGAAAWKKWGPHLSERKWGTVREDYSETGQRASDQGTPKLLHLLRRQLQGGMPDGLRPDDELGASHQTGWTGAVASLIQLFGNLDAETLLAAGKSGAFTRGTSQ